MQKQLKSDVKAPNNSTAQNVMEDDSAKQTWTTNKTLGICATLVVGLSETGSSVCVQLLNHSIPAWELNALRQSLPLLLILIGFCYHHKKPSIPKHAFWWVVANSLFLSVGPGLFYVSVRYLPLSLLNCIHKTVVIIIGVILFRAFLHEIFTCFKFIATVLCLAGIIFSVQPWRLGDIAPALNIENNNNSMDQQIGPNEKSTNDQIQQDSMTPIFIFGYCTLILSGILEGSGTVLNKYINTKEILNVKEYIWRILFWQLFTALVISIAIMLLTEDPVIPSDWKSILLVTGHSAFGFLFYLSALYAITKINGQIYNIIWNSSTIVFMLFSQFTIVSHIQPGYRNWGEVLGAVLVMIGTIISTLIETDSKLCQNLLNSFTTSSDRFQKDAAKLV